MGDLATHVIDLSRFLVGEIVALSAVVKTFIPGRKVDDAVESVVEFDAGAVGTIEATRLALGRRNAMQWEINGSKASLWFDMERMNELHVFRADGDRARGAKTVLVTEADHPFARYWWPPGHIVGWGDTFTHEVIHLLEAIAGDHDVAPLGATFEDGYHQRERGLRTRSCRSSAERPPRRAHLPLALVSLRGARTAGPSSRAAAAAPSAGRR